MVISPRNLRLGLSAMVKRVGLMDQPDNPDGELIKYKVHHLLFESWFMLQYIEETEELAMNNLKQNRYILDIIANELLENSRIIGLEVKAKLEGLSPVMFENFAQLFQINLDEIQLEFYNPQSSGSASLVSCVDSLCNLAVQTAEVGCS
ncbi:hypothetical protein IFM89_007093 [Coptis chinensis]|uniref:Uncharacterized protein n=1 Tax=Coptis chinensis TaxID=261450 RepID=A0A835H722_9MAGN|nr:hypothetical protein IFM89_007093 [Coptis chinensis]